jgi:hypothetical protein
LATLRRQLATVEALMDLQHTLLPVAKWTA